MTLAAWPVLRSAEQHVCLLQGLDYECGYKRAESVGEA